MMRVSALACAALLAGCAAARYDSQTTYDKLAHAYPYIRIADSDVPAGVVAHRGLEYARRASSALQLDLYVPASAADKAVPGIVWVHGGGWRSGTRDNMAPLAIRTAQRGYASATISYRLSGEARYPAAMHDVKAAVRWLRANAARYGVDPARIAIGGGSAGGQIAALAGMTNGVARFDDGGGAVSSDVQAVLNIDGLSDFTAPEALLHEDDPAKKPSAAGAWFGGRYLEKEALWRDASPIVHAGPRSPPVLFIGSAQPRFSVGREAMVARLATHGVVSRVVLLPDTPHSFWLFEPWIGPTVDACADFLDAVLLNPALP